MISEDLKRKLKVASLEETSEALSDLCQSLIRAGYSNPQTKDEDIYRIYALVCNSKGQELKHDRWEATGKGFKFSSLATAKTKAKHANTSSNRGKVLYKLCIPTEDIVLNEWQVGDKEQEKELNKKLKELKEFKAYLALKTKLGKLGS